MTEYDDIVMKEELLKEVEENITIKHGDDKKRNRLIDELYIEGLITQNRHQDYFTISPFGLEANKYGGYEKYQTINGSNSTFLAILKTTLYSKVFNRVMTLLLIILVFTLLYYGYR